MDTKYILPFIHSIKNVFSTMLRTEVAFENPFLKTEHGDPAHDVSGIIGFTGTVKGAIVLSLPADLATKLIARFIGAEVPADDPDFVDAIGELVNMIAGGAKAQFEQGDVQITCPSVVTGSNHRVLQQKGQPIIAIPCSCELGAFVTEVALKNEADGSAGGRHAAA